jgi:RsiW-degrading membrane proteinase PrsW (M82 family)
MPGFTWALLGVIPPLMAMAYFDYLDRKRPEPPRLLRKLAWAGALAALPILIAELGLSTLYATYFNPLWSAILGEPEILAKAYQAFVVAATTEESGKLACLALFAFRRPEFDERMDGLVYGARVGLGFALVENVAYLLKAAESGDSVATFVARALLAVPGHATWGAVIGAFAAATRFDGIRFGLLRGWLLAIFLHGLYDFPIFLAPQWIAADRPLAALACLAVSVGVILFGALFIRSLARRALLADDRDALLLADRQRFIRPALHLR